MLTVVNPDESTPATAPAGLAGGSLIDEIVRDGARRMLAAALEAEVAAYIAAHAGQIGRATAGGWWCATATRGRGRC